MGARKPVLPVMVVCCVLVGWLAWSAVPALAAAPEAPEVSVEAPVHATTATLRGVLNPKAAASVEAGSYEFLYRQGKSGCVGGKKAPEPAGMAMGLQHEEVAEGLSGLAPDSEYMVCLRVESATTHQEALSPAVAFTTALPPETPETLKAESVTATTAMLHGVLNPKVKGEAGFYEFLYRPSASECEGFGATSATASLGGKEEVVSAEAKELMPGTQYTFCLLARNAAGEAAVGSPVTFMTPPAPPTVDSESVSKDETTSAILQAQVNPNNQKTTYFFEYSTQATGEVLEGTVVKVSGSSVLAGEFGDQTASAPTGVLLPGTIYYYRVVASNGTPPASKGKVGHFTTPEAPVIEPGVAHGSTVVALKGELNPDGASGPITYQFDYNTNGTCMVPKISPGEEAEGKQQPAQPSTSAIEVAEGKQDHVLAEATELEPNEQYTFCLVATNGDGGQASSNEVSLQTGRQAPTITGASVANIAATAATVSAQVYPHGETTAYYVQYGLTNAYGSSTPQVSISSQYGPAAIQAQLNGLTPDSEYHYRIIATNQMGTERTPDAIFTTSSATFLAGLGLPDNRAYEMVTPPNNHDANVYVPEAINPPLSDGVLTQRLFQASVDGTAVAYLADDSTGGYGAGGNGLGSEYIARRSSEGGWNQESIQPPADSGGYQGFSRDLSVGILGSGSVLEGEASRLSPEAPGEGYTVLYGRVNSQKTYQPFFTTKPLNRSPEEFLGREQYAAGRSEVGPVFAGESSDGNHRLFEANDSLLAGEGTLEKELETSAQEEIVKGEYHHYLYDSVGGRLKLVDVSPDGHVVPNATFGALPFVGSSKEIREKLQYNPPDFSNVISADGSRVYWTDIAAGVVYLREDGSSTVQVSAGAARYWTASEDGRYALYTEGEGEHSRLYRFDADAPVGSLGQREALTSSTSGVLGVVGASSNAETVYFVAEGVLSSGTNGEGAVPVAGQPNLYVLRDGGGPVFVATLSGEDGTEVPPYKLSSGLPSWGDWQPGLGHRTARVTGDGGAVVFMSDQQLSTVGYPHGYANGGLDEVYVYEASTNRLICASCGSNNGGSATYLPISWGDTYLPQWISEDGNRVFFDSDASLVPQDTNGVQDVYEWEREGAGSCSDGSGVNGGCVFLLSGGTSSSASWLIGESASGDDVFIATRAQLVPEDGNDAFDLYDARVDGVKPISPPECTGTGCQGVPAPPPTFATPPSVTFDGVGNFLAPSPPAVRAKAKSLTRSEKLTLAFKACRKDHKRKRVLCEARARRRYRPVKKSRGTARNATKGRG